jgi:hypothetical protein
VEVLVTRPRSEICKIGQSLHTLESEPQRLKVQTARLVSFCAMGGAVVSIIAVVRTLWPNSALRFGECAQTRTRRE